MLLFKSILIFCLFSFTVYSQDEPFSSESYMENNFNNEQTDPRMEEVQMTEEEEFDSLENQGPDQHEELYLEEDSGNYIEETEALER